MSETRVRFSGTTHRLARTIALSVVTGILAGLAARGMEDALGELFPWLIGGVVRPEEAASLAVKFDWRILVFPMLGGLISGVALTFLCRPAPAHGTAELIVAFHRLRGRLPLRDTAVRAVTAIAVIALGCSVGKEAAIAVLAASIGSTIAGLMKLSPRETRVFLVAGCAAGVGAIFKCPLGGALFGATVLYREPDVEADAMMPSVVASVIAYSTFMAFGGYGHRLLEGTETLSFTHPIELLAYVLLGMVCAGAAAVFFYCLQSAGRFRKWMGKAGWVSPAIAGLLVGIIALVFPQVMDARYMFIQASLDSEEFFGGQPWMTVTLVMGLVVVAKCAATGAMMGTESAGGLFGPVVFIGGAAGITCGAFLEALFPGTFPPELRQALIPVGMAGLTAASLRVPIAAVVMVMEMTGSYGLIVPLMLTSVVSYVLGRRWGVYGEQASGPEESPAHAGESVVATLETWKVEDLMDRSWPHVAKPATTLRELVAMMPPGTRPSFVVMDGSRLAGVLSTGDVARAVEGFDASAPIIAADIMTPTPHTASPDDDVYSILGLFRELNLDVIPVVEPEEGRFVGMLRRGAIHRAVRDRVSQQRAHMLTEHAAVVALDQEGTLDTLLSGLPAERKSTLERIAVPSEVVGKSLKESGFRAKFGEVIAIQTTQGDLLTPPDPSRPLEKDDHLILLPR